MSTPKHTPGPWELSDCGEHIIGQADQDEIIEVANLSNTLNTKANANLIAAAPEMLEALESVVKAIAEYQVIDEVKLMAAIKKAKGEL